MDARENLLRVVRFERPSYIPMTFHINDACWQHYPQAALQDLMAAHPSLFPNFTRSEGPIIPVHAPYVRRDQPFVDPWGCVWETTEDGMIGSVVKHPLANWDDFATFTPPNPDEMTHWGPMDWKANAGNLGPAICQKSLRNGEIGHNYLWLKLTDLRGYENTLFDMSDGEPRLLELIEMLLQFNAGLVRNYIKYGRAEWLGFAEDLGTQMGPMLSPEHFRNYIKPGYQRLMKIAHDAGCIVHTHADGHLHALMDDLLTCGIDVLNLQDLVNGISWIKQNLKGRICIDLDLDRQNVTAFGTPAQIDALVREEVEQLGSKEGGLMIIYGLYPGVPLENAEAVMNAMEKYAGHYS